MAVTRRSFLKSAGLGLFGAGAAPNLMDRRASALTGKAAGGRNVLVVLFQGGGADGLNMVIPFGDQEYFALRPTIAIPAPRSARAQGVQMAIDQDGFFGLHPSLASMKPLFDAGHLGVIHAVGSPDYTRSHFEARDFMETAAPGAKPAREGWLNRCLEANSTAGAAPFRAVALGTRLPLTLRGRESCVVLDHLKNFRSPDVPLTKPDAENLEAIRTLRRLAAHGDGPSNGARYPEGRLGDALQQVARLIKAGVGLEAAFVETGGWDTHVDEGSVAGQLANNLKQLGGSLAAFHRDLGRRMESVVVLTVSEFGRTARENGNRGTGHGHANAMFALGGPVKGGKVYGRWPGLGPGQLHDGGGLAMTTDFRDVLAEVAVRHLGAQNTSQIFPGYTVSPAKFKGFLG